LRTPIQPILCLSELLRRRKSGSAVGDNKQEIEKLDTIIRNAKKLLRLEQNMLDMTKIENRSLKLDKEKFDLIENIQPVINDFGNESSNNKIQLVFTQPSQKEPIFINAVRISEVISNLLGNAIKFTTKEAVRNITIKAEKKNNEANVSIKDTGSGINPEIKPKLFSKFVTDSPGGTGIGLFISKSIVKAHGGRIWAENNANGKGATFAFSLPLNELTLPDN
jgi:signal transduction histidine kinase